MLLAVVLFCFIFALFFGIATAAAITQMSVQHFIVLFSFCYLFGLAGNSFMTVAGQLYTSVRS
jgi:hypothetical protein